MVRPLSVFIFSASGIDSVTPFALAASLCIAQLMKTLLSPLMTIKSRLPSCCARITLSPVVKLNSTSPAISARMSGPPPPVEVISGSSFSSAKKPLLWAM